MTEAVTYCSGLSAPERHVTVRSPSCKEASDSVTEEKASSQAPMLESLCTCVAAGGGEGRGLPLLALSNAAMGPLVFFSC